MANIPKYIKVNDQLLGSRNMTRTIFEICKVIETRMSKGDDTYYEIKVKFEDGFTTWFWHLEDIKELDEYGLDYDDLPTHVKDVLNTFDENEGLADECDRILNELNAIGWTFDYGLDYTPSNFKLL